MEVGDPEASGGHDRGRRGYESERGVVEGRGGGSGRGGGALEEEELEVGRTWRRRRQWKRRTWRRRRQ